MTVKRHGKYDEVPAGMKRITVSVTIQQDFFVPDTDEYPADELKECVLDASHITFTLGNNEDFEPVGDFDEEWKVEGLTLN